MPAPIASAQQADDALMLRVRDDESVEAFGELYNRYVQLGLRIAWSVCRDAARAEEVVQDGFLSIWRGRARYRPDSGSVKGWMLTHVHRRAIDAARRSTAGQLVELPAAAPPKAPPSPLDVVIARDEGDALRADVAQLPDAQSEVIRLAFYGGLTHSEIAEQLSLPSGTVKGRMRLGLQKLRATLDERAG